MARAEQAEKKLEDTNVQLASAQETANSGAAALRKRIEELEASEAALKGETASANAKLEVSIGGSAVFDDHYYSPPLIDSSGFGCGACHSRISRSDVSRIHVSSLFAPNPPRFSDCSPNLSGRKRV